ncbi:unnamed protein product [Aphis gossypii]|uniref:Uncharacterized protein n=1 Tax=Aphis gossypii TaxID=80765 RepID=A0A9P0IRJ8_APHGO|nr:unnamed protein product [Aphis gossypii]
MRGWTRHLADAAQRRRGAVYPSFLVVVVVILLLFVRSSVHSSPTFNSHEMNIDWQVPRVGVRVRMIAVVVVVFECCCHRVTTPVTVVRGVGNIMSPRNFPSSSACRLQSAAKTAEVVVHLCRWVRRRRFFTLVFYNITYILRSTRGGFRVPDQVIATTVTSTSEIRTSNASSSSSDRTVNRTGTGKTATAVGAATQSANRSLSTGRPVHR